MMGWRIISSSTIVYGVLRCWYKSLGIGVRDMFVTDDLIENSGIVTFNVLCQINQGWGKINCETFYYNKIQYYYFAILKVEQ